MFCVRWDTLESLFSIPVSSSSCHTNVSNCHFAIAELKTFANVDFFSLFLTLLFYLSHFDVATAISTAAAVAADILQGNMFILNDGRRVFYVCIILIYHQLKNSNTIFVYMQLYTIKCSHCVCVVYAGKMGRKDNNNKTNNPKILPISA